MRIKLSKQNWRLVGQKMGWLKRAQLETGAGGVTGSTGAMEAMGIGPGKITPESLAKSLKNNTGNVDEGIDYNEASFDQKAKNIRRDQGLFTDVQFEQLKEIDFSIKSLFKYVDIRQWRNEDWIEEDFGSIKSQNRGRSGPITFESFEDALKNWGHIEERIKQGQSRAATMSMQSIINNHYTPAQLQRFERAAQERRQKLESTKALVRNTFRTFMAGKPQPQPQIQNTKGLDLGNAPVEL